MTAQEACGGLGDPEVPGLPAQPGSGPHSPGMDPGDAARWSRQDQWIDAYARAKAARGVALDEKIEWSDPARYARWAPPRCPQPGCAWGFVDVAEDGSRVAPCPSCRAARAGGETR